MVTEMFNSGKSIYKISLTTLETIFSLPKFNENWCLYTLHCIKRIFHYHVNSFALKLFQMFNIA